MHFMNASKIEMCLDPGLNPRFDSTFILFFFCFCFLISPAISTPSVIPSARAIKSKAKRVGVFFSGVRRQRYWKASWWRVRVPWGFYRKFPFCLLVLEPVASWLSWRLGLGQPNCCTIAEERKIIRMMSCDLAILLLHTAVSHNIASVRDDAGIQQASTFEVPNEWDIQDGKATKQRPRVRATPLCLVPYHKVHFNLTWHYK